jgi:hypothetical protein
MAVGTALAIGGAAALAGGVGNYLANKSAAERAEMLQNQALQDWIAINIPDPKDQQLALQDFVSQGKLNPKLENSIKADPSAFKSVVTDFSQKNAQTRALSELEKVGYEGGLRLQDKAALQDAMMETQDKERGNRLAIGQEMSRRGLGGSGFELASKLEGQQGAADRNSRASLDIASRAQDRALQSIMNAGDMASKYRSQDFSEKSAKAAADDKINLFNTTNMQDIQQRNIASQNQAAAQNLAEQQRLADTNVKQNNYEQEHNRNLLQQNFDNEVKKTAGKTGQIGALANNTIQQGQNLGNLYSNIGQGIAGAGTAAASYSLQQQGLNQQQQNNQNQMDMLDKYLKSQKR